MLQNTTMSSLSCGFSTWIIPWLQIILNMDSFCMETNGTRAELSPELIKVKDAFTILQVTCCILGVFGNILNLQTLRSPSLQTVPFMYIKSLAIFDLIALTMILIHYCLVSTTKMAFVMYYTTYIEAPFINGFLISGLYCSFLLTLERYFLISRPHQKPTPFPREQARRRIYTMLALSFLIHLPMVLQRRLSVNENGEYVIKNNVELLCQEPNWSLYNYYKLIRECVRFLIVISMTIINIIIARKLQITKKRRRRLVRRSSPQNEIPNGISADSESNVNSFTMRREDSNLIRSFTEKKLTVLMISICVIFLLGNVPQIVVMILQNEAMETNFNFQLYRHCSNTLEVLNHCLNFYVFCIASSEYTRAFLLNCNCLQNMMYRFPRIARFVSRRRSSSVMVSSGGFGVANREYLSMESVQEEQKKWVVDPSTSPYSQTDSNLRSILVTGAREPRQKKSLTIVNHCAVEEDVNSHEVTQI
ncbi:G-protein coupled receptors family 1 profile domain-containing protein [Caenorhabditis elegans]|uniref:G-protein coupled receptors family 1 profile domain-containing protein n=1 Tax=Caenorhabditis elegans TaxID=6239 RepID=P91064_CAEEL|nr:G-protein coupled receptors family 1 profile domain-containing protein [Caenorhabditis elegans]CCD64980.1 G-protein coupled receptors family 1 profile domain-containing protein [Caenorhabditis elegans]|eukprot:NP_509379.1 Uncharacterized protein CELE_C17H11.1 [Caenorhabditis elegans]